MREACSPSPAPDRSPSRLFVFCIGPAAKILSGKEVSLRDWVRCEVSWDAPEVDEGSPSREKAVGVRTSNLLFAAGRRGISSREAEDMTTAFLERAFTGRLLCASRGTTAEPGKDPSGPRILGRQMATGE